jgi:hypothetical protein
MKGGSAAVLLLVAALAGTGLEAQNPDPRPTPPPVNPRGMTGGLPGVDSGTAWPPADAPASPASSSASPTPAATAIDAAINSLTRELDERRNLTASTVRPVDSLSVVSASLDRYRRAYVTMRERLYMGDPKPGSEAATAIDAFVTHWGALASRIWAGDRRKASISASEWTGVVRRVRGGPCPIVAPIPPALDGRPPDGPVWACLSDAYFADLAEHEAKTNGSIDASRARALAPLRAALGGLDEWMTRTEGLRRTAPESAELRRQAAWAIHNVWVAGATARRDELVRLRNRSPLTPFQRFLAHAPAIVRPPELGVMPIALPTGRISARTGAAVSEVAVVSPPIQLGAALAEELHDVHYRLRTIEARLDEQDRQALAEFAVTLQRTIAAAGAAVSPRETADFRDGMADAAKDLRDERPGKVERLRAELERRRTEILQRMAGW